MWASVLLYVAVAVTIVSGADYFLNFRKRIEEARDRIAERSPGNGEQGATPTQTS